jgi:CubicO group peptidase (beta-lactamase class C family)
MIHRDGLVFVALSVLASAAEMGVTPARLEEQVKAYVDIEKFNGTVLVMKDGQAVLNKGYGMANFEWAIPNTPDTKFRLGSITKQFTAMAILELERQGKLQVTDPVCTYVDPCPEKWKPITIHNLLTHTSGIPNFTSFPEYDKTKRTESPPAKTLERFRDKPLDFEPGEKFSYSNSGYVLLGFIIEKVTGGKYEDFLQKNIFGPLSMNDTGYDHGETVMLHRASGYAREGKTLKNAPFLDMSIPHAAGSLYSTTSDLAKWDAALTAGKLIPKESMEKYFTPFKATYAYGWDVQTRDGHKVMSHGGGIDGFATMIVRIPDERLLVVTLSNVVPSEAGKLANELVKLAEDKAVELPKGRHEIMLSDKVIAPYVGEYTLSATFVLTVTQEGNRLFTQATGQPKVEVFPEDETNFFLKVVDAQITFQKDASGKVTGLVLHQNGLDLPAKKK